MYLVITSDNINVTTPVYFKQFATFYDTWLMNKYIGGGIKNLEDAKKGGQAVSPMEFAKQWRRTVAAIYPVLASGE